MSLNCCRSSLSRGGSLRERAPQRNRFQTGMCCLMQSGAVWQHRRGYRRWVWWDLLAPGWQGRAQVSKRQLWLWQCSCPAGSLGPAAAVGTGWSRVCWSGGNLQTACWPMRKWHWQCWLWNNSYRVSETCNFLIKRERSTIVNLMVSSKPCVMGTILISNTARCQAPVLIASSPICVSNFFDSVMVVLVEIT